LSAREAAQSFTAMKGVVDLIDFIHRLEDRQIYLEEAEALRGHLESEVILYERHYSSAFSLGPGVSSGNVDRATGLAINLPLPGDLTQEELSQYGFVCDALGIPGWCGFVEDFINEARRLTADNAQGGFVVQTFWTTSYGDASHVDLDLYIVEPGHVFAPWMGQATPNGFFGPDSMDAGTNYEIYVAREVIQKGTYIPVINYYDSKYSFMQPAWCYLLYFPRGIESDFLQSAPRLMGLWNPAPEVWDDFTIYLLSSNYYSDWWIPTAIERLLSRAPIESQRRFWAEIRRQRKMKKWHMP